MNQREDDDEIIDEDKLFELKNLILQFLENEAVLL